MLSQCAVTTSKEYFGLASFNLASHYLPTQPNVIIYVLTLTNQQEPPRSTSNPTPTTKQVITMIQTTRAQHYKPTASDAKTSQSESTGICTLQITCRGSSMSWIDCLVDREEYVRRGGSDVMGLLHGLTVEYVSKMSD